MGSKKGFSIYYLLLCEGSTEFNLFAYLTKNKFRELFARSRIQFSNKVEIINKNGKQVVSQGKLDGVSNITHFKSKHSLIKGKYAGQTLFYLLDKDMADSSAIGTLIMQGGDIVQFIEYNSEHLLLKLAGKKPKNPSDFGNLSEFRNYCKEEFLKEFKKNASTFKDLDFKKVFDNVTKLIIRNSFAELFDTLKTK